MEAACRTAYELIDLSKQKGVHPRLGAVDLVPLHPISENMSLQTLGAVAKGEYLVLSYFVWLEWLCVLYFTHIWFVYQNIFEVLRFWK